MNALDVTLRGVLASIPGIATAAPGGVHNTVRAQGTAFPAVVFRMVSAVDDQSFGGPGVEAFEYDVRIVAPISRQASVGQLLDNVHDALERVPLLIDGWTHLQTLRSARIPTLVEAVDGVVYVHRGATYRVWAARA